ncbi:MAG TPA: NUDIX hydrolase [Candidatus Saccharimonadales bacterium]|nr:NUDIX hydrolase [Candidatus Saccharimonadales bacterium]
MNDHALHHAQILILKTLRRNKTMRYNNLMRPSGLESDIFKFHIHKLVKIGYIQKLPLRGYELTVRGKEFANNLDEAMRVPQRQPKLSMIIVASKVNDQGDRLFLCQQRLREPYWGYWGFISGAVQWGVSIEDAALHEFTKQTHMTASFTVRSFCRQRDYDSSEAGLLEDKLFAVVLAENCRGEIDNSWGGGMNKWMTLAKLARQDKRFASTPYVIELLAKSKAYISVDARYDKSAY